MKKLFLIASGMVAVLLGSVRGEAIELDPLDFRLADRSTQRTSPMPKPKASVELSFDLPNPALRPKMPRQIAQPQPLGKAVAPRTAQSAIATLFDGGSDSLVAKTVGHAEGTRTAAGGRTRAYYGHIDPGNGVWNLGSFSYQHCYRQCTPEEADDRQLQRLRNQSKIIQQKAADYGMQLSLEEKLNGIDLANQAPLAALDQGGYVDHLNVAFQRGLFGSDAVLWARTYSFINPKTQTWDAPGLGNTFDRISSDQERRRDAIAYALKVHQQQIKEQQ
ncbi:MAG: hypothetical protein HC780_03955 [Leptolyngbyaceae cyanobacterium CSU_1_3]|nr:hypothetical protein [Leptolyngbyaceae cyanobacterium CSU_1_3]